MSGNNYNDILENYPDTEKERMNSIIKLMSSSRPKYKIDRAFQRRLKNSIMRDTKKHYAWYFILPRLSLLFTSLLVFVGVWSIWGNLVPHKGIGVPSSRNSPSEGSINGLGDDLQFSDATSQASMKLSQAELSPGAIMQSLPSNEPNNNDIRENIVERASREEGIPTQKSIPLETREMNIDNEIAAIAEDIDAIIRDTSIPTPSPNISEPALMTMRAMSTNPINTSAILIDYPDRMAVYEKSSPWTEEERGKRSASGAIKLIVATLSHDDIRLTLDTTSEIREMKIEYRTAIKEGVNSFSLIPCLRYTNSRGVFYSPLITGYTLD